MTALLKRHWILVARTPFVLVNAVLVANEFCWFTALPAVLLIYPWWARLTAAVLHRVRHPAEHQPGAVGPGVGVAAHGNP